MTTGLASVVLASAAVAQVASPQPPPGVSAVDATVSPSMVASPSPSASPDPSALAATVDVQAFDLGFVPTTIELPAIGTSRIVLANTGYVAHNLTVDALGIKAVASRGGTAEAFVTDPSPGTYEFYCSVSGHKEGGMVGTLVVHESAPVEPTGAPSPTAASLGARASG